MKFGSLCRKLRMQFGLSVQAVSAMTGISVVMILKIEAGKKQPVIGNVVGLIRALKITPEQLDELYGGLWPRQEHESGTERSSTETSEDQRQKIPWYQRENA